jgi:hypothetical protein
MAFNTSPAGQDTNACRPDRPAVSEMHGGKARAMDRRPEETIANVDDGELNVFVRSSPQELDPDELDRVAGGAGPRIDPEG